MKNEIRNVTMQLEVVRRFKRSARVRIRLSDALLFIDPKRIGHDERVNVNPRYTDGYVEVLVRRTDLSEVGWLDGQLIKGGQ